MTSGDRLDEEGQAVNSGVTDVLLRVSWNHRPLHVRCWGSREEQDYRALHLYQTLSDFMENL